MLNRFWGLCIVMCAWIASPVWAADVDELFEASLWSAKIDVGLLGAGQLDDTRCWGHAKTSDELVCVVFESKDEAATWSLVVFEPTRGEIERHLVATRADAYADPARGKGYAAANAALKKRRWLSIDAKLGVFGPATRAVDVPLSGGRVLRHEGGFVKLVAGETVAEVDVSVAPKQASWTFYELGGGVVVVEAKRTPAGEVARLFTLRVAMPDTGCASCPAGWAELSPLMGKLCEGAFGEAELATLREHVAQGRLDKDEVARLWNTVGAMTGFVFKTYPQWNALFHGNDKAALPAACQPWLAKAHKEAALPKSIRAGRDLIRAYWKTL